MRNVWGIQRKSINLPSINLFDQINEIAKLNILFYLVLVFSSSLMKIALNVFYWNFNVFIIQDWNEKEYQ